MQKKTIAMMVVAGCAAMMLTGCGVKQEIHDAKVAELNTAWQEIEGLKGKNADLDSLLNAEKAKLSSTRTDLDAATGRIKKLTAKEAETASALADEKAKVADLSSDLSSAKAKATSAQEAADEAGTELATLQAAYKTLQARWNQFNKNMQTLGQPQSATPGAAVQEGDERSALDLLNEMGEQ